MESSSENPELTTREEAARYFGPDALRWGPRFDVLVDKLKKERAAVPEYMAFLKMEYPVMGGTPSVMYSGKALAGFAAHREERRKASAVHGRMDREYFQAKVSAGYGPEEVLSDPNTELTPLFRYLMALTLGRYKMAMGFKEAAMAQLDAAPEYRKVFATFEGVMPRGGSDEA